MVTHGETQVPEPKSYSELGGECVVKKLILD